MIISQTVKAGARDPRRLPAITVQHHSFPNKVHYLEPACSSFLVTLLRFALASFSSDIDASFRESNYLAAGVLCASNPPSIHARRGRYCLPEAAVLGRLNPHVSSLGSAAESDRHTLKYISEAGQPCLNIGPSSDNTVNTLACGASRASTMPTLLYVANCSIATRSRRRSR